jgi:hypothetical protein
MVRNVKIPCGIEIQAEIIVKLESMEPCNSVKVLFFFKSTTHCSPPSQEKEKIMHCIMSAYSQKNN